MPEEIKVEPAVLKKEQVAIEINTGNTIKAGIEIGLETSVASKSSVEVSTEAVSIPK